MSKDFRGLLTYLWFPRNWNFGSQAVQCGECTDRTNMALAHTAVYFCRPTIINRTFVHITREMWRVTAAESICVFTACRASPARIAASICLSLEYTRLSRWRIHRVWGRLESPLASEVTVQKRWHRLGGGVSLFPLYTVWVKKSSPPP